MMTRVPCFRLAAMICLLLSSGASTVHAQKTIERTYMIEFSGLDDRSDEKVVLSALIDQDPNALISIGLATHQAKVRTIAVLDRSILQSTIAPAGIGVVRFNQLVSVPMHQPDRQAETAPHTDQELDAYRQQKLLWMIEHPGVPFPVDHQQPIHEH